MNYGVLEIPENVSARSRIMATLTQEILNRPEGVGPPLESESQLCRRFGVSRVTVRHALSELEHRGLIYRKHGKGTFVHGHSTRIHRNIALLFKLPQSIEDKIILELVRGAQAVTASLRSALLLVHTSSTEWRADTISSLAGVIVMPQNVTLQDVTSLKERKLKFISIGESHLPAPRFIPCGGEKSFFQAGKQAAEVLSRAALTGETLIDFSIEVPTTQSIDTKNSSVQ